MKIALLTMVFNNNYGGILQAYALHRYLTDLGHEVTLINAQQKLPPLIQAPYSISKRLFLKYILKKDVDFIMPDWVYRNMRKIREANTRAFIDAYINPKTKTVYTNKGIKRVAQGFDCYIVGSDQVWRPTMYPFIDSAFFGFLKNREVKRVSYAASFGVDRWEYSEEQTARFKDEIQRFDCVSVREKSGVELCKKHFDVEAYHLIDPTMLLGPEYYKALAGSGKDNRTLSKQQLFCYFLDPTDDKHSLQIKLLSHLGYRVSVFPSYLGRSRNFVYPKVSLWLEGFINSDYVLTDSFHGCVFSLIFNKPFIVYGNLRRGIDRFNSLLSLFNLEHRLVLSSQDFNTDILEEEISWDKINEQVKKEQEMAYEFFRLAGIVAR